MKTITLPAVLLLAACGAAGDAEAPAADSAPFDDLTQAIDKAEAVELKLQEQKDRMDKALQEAERPPE